MERESLEQLRLGEVPEDASNAWSDDPAAAALGQQFFWDPRFSGPLQIGDDGSNGSLGQVGETGLISCGSCHDVGLGGGDQRSNGQTSLGSAWTNRNAPTVLNAAFQEWFFWDGRADSLWSQALGPTEAAAEHNTTRLAVAHVIVGVYREPYEAVFGALPDLSDPDRFPTHGKPGDAEFDGMNEVDRDAVNTVFVNFGKAIAAYERRLVDTDSQFDRWMAGDVDAMPAAAVRGARLFVGRASCNDCHRGPALSDGGFHAIGVAQEGDRVPAVDPGRSEGLDHAKADPFNRAGAWSDAQDGSHLVEATEGRESAFRTPTLRNVTRTAPYMHTGSISTLWDVLEHYRFGGNTDVPRDAEIQPLSLTDDDLHDLIAFLQALEGDPLDPTLTGAPELP